MPNYSFNFKKGNVILELISDDSEFIEEQSRKNFEKLSRKYWKKKSKSKKIVKENPPVQPEAVKAEVIIEPEKTPVPEYKEPEVIINQTNTNDFEHILDSKINQVEPQQEPYQNITKPDGLENIKTVNPSKAESLEELIGVFMPKSLDEYLLITAYYLKIREKTPRYSLKQINTKCIKLSKKPIDHSILQKAVVNGYIVIVPDYTGMAEVTEYAITEKGEKYLLNGFK